MYIASGHQMTYMARRRWKLDFWIASILGVVGHIQHNVPHWLVQWTYCFMGVVTCIDSSHCHCISQRQTHKTQSFKLVGLFKMSVWTRFEHLLGGNWAKKSEREEKNVQARIKRLLKTKSLIARTFVTARKCNFYRHLVKRLKSTCGNAVQWLLCCDSSRMWIIHAKWSEFPERDLMFSFLCDSMYFDVDRRMNNVFLSNRLAYVFVSLICLNVYLLNELNYIVCCWCLIVARFNCLHKMPK